VTAEDLTKESFIATITILKEEAEKHQISITDIDIANALNISLEQFNNYIASDDAPNELFPLLRSKYDFLKNTTHHRFVHKEILPDPEDDEN
jgi:hypothetical protein